MASSLKSLEQPAGIGLANSLSHNLQVTLRVQVIQFQKSESLQMRPNLGLGEPIVSTAQQLLASSPSHQIGRGCLLMARL